MLRPGEKKILQEIKTKPKTFSQIQSDTKLAYNILSEYLKNLQHLGLITRNVDNREYCAEEPSLQVLFFHDILDFLQQRFAEYIRKKSGIAYHNQWLIATATDHDGVQIEKMFKKRFSSDMSLKLAQIGELASEYWKNRKLSLLSPKNREIVQKYRACLLAVMRILTRDKKRDLDGYRSLLEISKAELKHEYPSVQVSDLMVYYRATRTFREVRAAQEKILQPWTLEDLKERVSFLLSGEHGERHLKTISPDEEQEISDLMDFLENPKNHKIYEKYTEQLKEAPKTLLLCPMIGFRDYPTQLASLLTGE